MFKLSALLLFVASVTAQDATCPDARTIFYQCRKTLSRVDGFTTKCDYSNAGTVYCKPVSGTGSVTNTTKPLLCTYEDVKACTPPPCQGKLPQRVSDSCCPSCSLNNILPPICPVPPDCQNGVIPAKDTRTGCLTCKVPITLCTLEKFKACAQQDLRTCGAMEKPMRTAECCLTCSPPVSSCNFIGVNLLVNRSQTCATPYDSLPECVEGVSPVFNPDTCCRSCRPKPPQVSVCDKAAFLKCVNTTDECDSDENPLVRKGFCCRSCRRPQRKCTFREVVSNCRKLPECEDGQRPVSVEGSCCPSCRPIPPLGCASCLDTQICVRTNLGPKCFKKRVRKLLFKVSSAFKDAAASLTAEDARLSLIELVERFCDKNENTAKLCEALDRFRENVRVKLDTSSSEGTAIDVELPENDVGTGRRLLQLAPADPSELLDAASRDAETTGGDVSVTDRSRVCPALPSRTICSKTQDTTFTQKCVYGTVTAYCKKPDGIPSDGDGASVPMTCTSDKVRQCLSATDIPGCPDGVRPRFNFDTCCPTCKFQADDEKPTCPVPTDCAEGVRPEFKDGCLTCKIPITMCSVDQLKACRDSWSSLGDCLPGETPRRTKDCCLSCKPVRTVCGQDSDEAGLDRPTMCMKAYKDLDECAPNVTPVFDTTTCCRSCRLALPSTKPTCTKEEFLKCTSGQYTCSNGEAGLSRADFCCKTCRRPARKCTVQDVAKTCSRVPVCESGEKPARIAGSCCPSCRPARPKCDTECTDKQLCVRSKDNQPKCVNKRARLFKVKLAQMVKDVKTGNMTVEELREVVVEVVQRFCDKIDNDAKCARVKEFVQDLVVKIKNKISDDEVEIEVDTAEQPAGRRLLAAQSDLLSAAFADEEASNNFQFASADTPPAPTGPAETTSSASAVHASTALVVALAFLA